MDEKYLEYIRHNRKKIGVSIVVLIFLIALGIAILPDKYFRHAAMQSNKTVYVASDGSGDFNCDGSDDQVEINKALAYVAENPQFRTVFI